MTPTSVGLVLVGGHNGTTGTGVTVECDAVEIGNSDEAAAAILRSEALAATRGLRLKSIGVTWSEDVDAEASKLLKTLSDSGFDNIVPVALPAATEALARGLADALGYPTTAVCAIEPDTVITMIVRGAESAGGAVHTAFNHAIYSDECLISWLSMVFTRADWQPDALVVVGSAGDFGEVCQRLHDALSVPVYSPAEAELALAKGAALASTTVRSAEFVPPEPYRGAGRHRRAEPRPARRSVRPGRRAAVLPLAMLVGGSVSLVASVSMAVSMQLNAVRHLQPVPTAASETVPAVVVSAPAEVPAVPAPEAIEPPQIEQPVAPAPTEELPADATPLDRAPEVVDAAPTEVEPSQTEQSPTELPADEVPPVEPGA